MPIVLSKKAGGSGGGGAPSGPAGGSLSGTYPNPTLGTDVVDTPNIADDAVEQAQIADDAVGNDQIADNAVQAAQIAAGAVGRSEMATGIGAMDLLASSVLGSAGVFDFNSISGSYSHLWLLLILRTTANSGATASLVFNADTGANYYRTNISNTNATVSGTSGVAASNGLISPAAIVGTTDTAGRATHGTIWIPGYKGTTFHKDWISLTHNAFSNVAGGQNVNQLGGTWASTSAITRIQIDPSAGSTFVTGSSVWLYGVV